MADCCILFTTTLQKQNAAPRFPLVSFCRCCFLPAVFFRFRSKKRRCIIRAAKRIPLQSLSVGMYVCIIHVISLFHTAGTGYEGRDLINNPDAEHRGTVLNVSYCVFYKVVAVGFDTLYYGEKRRGTKHSA